MNENIYTPAPSKDRSALRLGAAFFALIFLTIVGQLVISLIVELLIPEFAYSGYYSWILSIVPVYMLGLPVFLLILGKNTNKVDFEKKKMSFPMFLLSIVITIGVMTIGNIIGNTLMSIVSIIKRSDIANPIEEVVMNSNLLVTFICTVIIAPFGEEFIFRRLLIDRTRKYGDLAAILISAFLFAAFHMNFYQFFYAFLVGAVLAYVYIKTGRVLYTVGIHAFLNFLGGVVSTILLKNIDLTIFDSPTPNFEALIGMIIPLMCLLAQSGLMYGCLIATVIIVCVKHKSIALEKGDPGIKKCYLSPFMIIFFAICAVFALLNMIL